MPSFDIIPKKKDPAIEDLIVPMVDIRADMCPFCKAQRVELFSFNGYSQNYKEAVQAHLKGYDVRFDRYEIRSMKCRGCNKEFTIDWSYRFPVPLKDTFKTNQFFKEFINGI